MSMEKVAFAVDEVIVLECSRWMLDGRAYEDIKVGDVVMAGINDELLVENTYVVIAISTYRKNVPELSRGVTGSLTVIGEKDGLPQEVNALVFATEKS